MQEIPSEAVELSNEDQTLARHGKLEEARGAFDKAILRAPGRASVYLDRAEVLERLGAPIPVPAPQAPDEEPEEHGTLTTEPPPPPPPQGSGPSGDPGEAPLEEIPSPGPALDKWFEEHRDPPPED